VTAQEVFDVAVEGVILQGAPSINLVSKKARGFRYRTPEGLACAAGQVLPDEYYDATMEGQSLGVLAKEEDFPGPLKGHAPLLMGLQQAHDVSAAFNPKEREEFLEDFSERARGVANRHDLTVPPLLEELRGASVDAR
jgi:hypothetical protein